MLNTNFFSKTLLLLTIMSVFSSCQKDEDELQLVESNEVSEELLTEADIETLTTSFRQTYSGDSWTNDDTSYVKNGNGTITKSEGNRTHPNYQRLLDIFEREKSAYSNCMSRTRGRGSCSSSAIAAAARALWEYKNSGLPTIISGTTSQYTIANEQYHPTYQRLLDILEREKSAYGNCMSRTRGRGPCSSSAISAAARALWEYKNSGSPIVIASSASYSTTVNGKAKYLVIKKDKSKVALPLDNPGSQAYVYEKSNSVWVKSSIQITFTPN